MDLSEHENLIIEKIIEKCDAIIRGFNKCELQSTVKGNLELIDTIVDEDGIVIKAKEGGGWGIAEDIISILQARDIKFKILRQQDSRFDGGVSGGFEEILLFIGTSAVSGIIWDVLKGMITSRVGIENLRTTIIDGFKFKQFRRALAERIVEDRTNLVLNDFYKQQNEMIFEFKVYGINEQTITVLCNSEYQIQELKVDRKECF